MTDKEILGLVCVVLMVVKWIILYVFLILPLSRSGSELERERHKAYKAGFDDGFDAGRNSRFTAYENELECLHYIIDHSRRVGGSDV